MADKSAVSLIISFALKHHKSVIITIVAATLLIGSLTIFIKVDTDPENMLDEKEPVRIFHNQTKEKFALYDTIVIGIINEKHPNGVFNPQSLKNIYELTEFAKTLKWEDKTTNQLVGVVENDIIAPSLVDYIGQGGVGVVKFEWLMSKPPTTELQALEIRERAMSNPLLRDSLVSADGKALCIYLPITSKNLSYKIYKEIRNKVTQFEGDEKYFITGLPVAEDTFGVEMFIQMAISAPLAMITIFILMLIFFRKPALIIPPMILAVCTVIITMGLLIGTGFPVHIMSSMIPIFLMPISVVDSVHILSEFFDRYTKQKGREQTITEVMTTLFTPMLYTSLTSAAGFASLSLTPIKPVQVFGIFVAIGVMIAWIFTITFIPASVMLIKENHSPSPSEKTKKETPLIFFLQRIEKLTYDYARPILIIFIVIFLLSIYGISKIEINDNPIKWFSKSHPIRQADIELNKHFAGTYMAYLVLDSPTKYPLTDDFIDDLLTRLDGKIQIVQQDYPNYPEVETIAKQIKQEIKDNAAKNSDIEKFLISMSEFAEKKYDMEKGSQADVWFEINNFFLLEQEKLKTFKQPQMLKYIDRLQHYLQQKALVGKTTSVVDVVKKVHKELIDGRDENYIVPDSTEKISQCLLQFQSSHNPDDLWHLITQDYKSANIWFQLRSGDNKDMTKVARLVDEFFAENPPPINLKYNWAGLTYINVIWQDRMVWGMLQSFAGSFLLVFIMMTILFRSVRWGLVCMIPLMITILSIYGIIGFVGKDYDMPVAVLSALTLGMAVDFAIHFLERSRWIYSQKGSWQECAGEMFSEPARAISRNVLVIAIGFLPLLAAPLIPYKTVGIFMCAIMTFGGIITLFALPPVLKIFEKQMFVDLKEPVTASCNCGLCFAVSASTVLLIALNLHQYWHTGIKLLSVIGAIVIVFSAVACGILSRRKVCKLLSERNNKNDD